MAVELKRGPTPAMRDWIKELGVIVAMPIIETSDTAAAPSNGSGAQSSSSKPRQKVGGDPSDLVGGIPGLPDLPDIPDVGIICRIKLTNQTDHVLRLDKNSIKLESGKFAGEPPDVIDKNDDVDFRAVNSGPLFLRGAVGQLEYIVDEQNTRWFIRWENARADLPNEQNEAPTHLTGPNKDKFKTKGTAGPNKKDDFTYILAPLGGSKPAPPKPDPTPTTDITASCQITVVNSTQASLKLAHTDNELGDFMTQPSASLAPGASTAFAYVETPHPKDKDQRGCKGSLTWEVGSPSAATWRVEWNNPFGQKNTASAKLDPQSAGFESLEQSGQGDENVPITFTLSGAGGGDGPKPDPKPDPTPEPAFNPPPGAREPTLRRGDKNADGWVEFLQQELNARGENLKIDGDFGASTLAAVIKFQKSQPGVQVDGVVGNQTWAALRQGQPEKPSTDGRKPHSFEEKGVQARWFLEKELCLYFKDNDEAQMSITSVGEQPIERFKATVRIARPNSKPKTVEIEIGPPVARTPDDQGNTHIVAIKNFRKDFMQGDTNDKLPAYVVEAYLPTEIGGDKTSGHILVI